mgnify:FL=1
MPKIYGFGNALIDIEISVSEDELASLPINKGSMEHISSNQKMDWLQRFQTRVQSREPGGSIANSMHAAASQGSRCTFSCSLGEDLEKDLFLEGFNKKLIKTSFQYSTNPTGICFIFVTPDGERTMASNLSANEDLNPKCLNKEILSQSDWLLFDAFSVCTSNGLKTAKEALLVAKQNKVKIAFGLADINLIKSNLKEIEWVLNQSIDLLFSNENEINLMQQSIKTKVDILCSSGANGCRFNQVKVDAKDISVINTNGAGDALVGIFLSHYNSLPQQEALKRAVDYATAVCQIGGPRI